MLLPPTAHIPGTTAPLAAVPGRGVVAHAGLVQGFKALLEGSGALPAAHEAPDTVAEALRRGHVSSAPEGTPGAPSSGPGQPVLQDLTQMVGPTLCDASTAGRSGPGSGPAPEPTAAAEDAPPDGAAYPDDVVHGAASCPAKEVALLLPQVVAAEASLAAVPPNEVAALPEAAEPASVSDPSLRADAPFTAALSAATADRFDTDPLPESLPPETPQVPPTPQARSQTDTGLSQAPVDLAPPNRRAPRIADAHPADGAGQVSESPLSPPPALTADDAVRDRQPVLPQPSSPGPIVDIRQAGRSESLVSPPQAVPGPTGSSLQTDLSPKDPGKRQTTLSTEGNPDTIQTEKPGAAQTLTEAADLLSPDFPLNGVQLVAHDAQAGDRGAWRSGPLPPSSVQIIDTHRTDWPESIVSTTVAAFGPEGGTLVIQLSPGDLGRLQITLTVEGDLATVQIQTETPDAARALSTAEDQLSQDFARHGVQLASHDAQAGHRGDRAPGRSGPQLPGPEHPNTPDQTDPRPLPGLIDLIA